MPKRYSIAEARHNLAAIIHELDHSPQIELTRRGQAVAVLLSFKEYKRLQSNGQTFWDAYTAFREKHAVDTNIVDELLQDLRDKSPAREIDL